MNSENPRLIITENYYLVKKKMRRQTNKQYHQLTTYTEVFSVFIYSLL